jgi:hypothetical protein
MQLAASGVPAMSGLVRMPWSTLSDLDIPYASVAHHSLNDDMVWVDRRCIRRYIRRARARPIEGALRVRWIRRLNALERRL